VTFGALTTGVGLAEDLHKGLIERFRSLPIARSAVLLGRTWADLVRNVFVVLLMAVVGFLVGWRITTNVLGLIACLALVVAFAYSLSWLFAIVGLVSPDAETAQAASFPILAPLVFASSAFVPVESMPGWLQVFAKHQPVTAVVDAARDLTIGGPTQTDVLKALAWIVAIIAVCAPIAVRHYRRAT
jgi:ABC-2 type transport system permease protein/oleandomycin transport system permease protein